MRRGARPLSCTRRAVDRLRTEKADRVTNQFLDAEGSWELATPDGSFDRGAGLAGMVVFCGEASLMA